MKNEYFQATADNKVKITNANVNDVQKEIDLEYQVGWTVQQILYLQKSDEIMILFKRSD